MTGPEATEFAARITAEIVSRLREGHRDPALHRLHEDRADDDMKRVDRDLAGHLRALDGLAEHGDVTPRSRRCAYCLRRADCRDLGRYAESRDAHLAALTETGSLYGVTP